MKMTVIMAAVVAAALGTGSLMARGIEGHERVGAFGKGGTGVVVTRSDAPAYGLTGRAAEPAKAPTTQHAAPCPKCKTVTETQPASSTRNMPTQTQVMKCDDCTNAVTNLLTRGEFKHTCKTCGDHVKEMCGKH